MKSEHRHELKTNELAEWLGNLPQWIGKNLTTILIVVAVMVAGVTVFFWRNYNKNVVQVQEHTELSNLLNQMSVLEARIPGAQAQGTDPSATLLQAAQSLGSFAQNTGNGSMAALALVKQAEAIRAELHYRNELISKEDFVKKINQAKAAYTEAVQKSSDSPAIKAAAELGLGLCEEELGNFELAKNIYQGVVDNPGFDGTVAKTAAKNRLETMDDYTQKVTFKPATVAAAASRPTIRMKPVDANSPPAAGQPPAPIILPEINVKVPGPNVSGK
ncbi:MAG: hypothetical protein JW837_06345 [Sedimentisphaerales bacterium]|nr:hypothetical protein [Sedimentisphaerales bacterium]